MRIIPVLDLLGGQVVRGVGGRRTEYRPIVSQLVETAEPAAVAAALKDRFDPPQFYVADLDAITSGVASVGAWRSIAATGIALLLDAGVRTLHDLVRIRRQISAEMFEARIIVGLESLLKIADLREMNLGVEIDQLTFSLDLRHGQPLTPDADWQRATPLEVVAEVQRCGIRSLIVLELADVGSGQGTSTLPLLQQLRRQFPGLELIAGGGVRGPADLRALKAAGASAALVASALHDGRLTPADCRER